MEHFEQQKPAAHSTERKNRKVAEALINTGFPLLYIHERAGARTPDNLIKSQGIEMPATPCFTVLPRLLVRHF